MSSLFPPLPVLASLRGTSRWTLGALLFAAAVHLHWLATGWGGAAWREALADLLPLPAFLLAALEVGRVAARHEGAARQGWRCLQGGMVAFVAGQGLWAYLELVAGVQPFPSVADAAFLLATPLFAAAFVRLWPSRTPLRAAAQLGLDVLTFALAAGVWFWNFQIAPAIEQNGAHPLALAISVTYPLYDLLLLSLVLVAVLRRATPPATVLFALGVLCFAFADIAFAALSVAGRYRSGHPLDASWVAGYVLFALSARASLRPGGGRAPRALRRAALLPDLAFMLPCLAVVLTSLLLALTHGQRGLGAGGVLLGTVLVTALVTLRQTLAWREARRLQRELRSLNLDLEGRVRERTLDVRRTFEGGLLALGTALEARDFETAGHTERVVKLARGLGQALGLPPDELEALTEGAYLHDLGKLAVPDHILLKPGALNPEEWTVMQSHATRGHALALRLPHLSPGALDVIRHHHERWDGSGYPYGLPGEAIPRPARVFAVCDVYDALTSERPYKRAWTPGEARAELRAQSGRHFDPRVVAAFLDLDLKAVLLRSSAAPTLQQAEQAFEARVDERTRHLRGALAETEALLALSRLSEVPHDLPTVLREALAAVSGRVALDVAGVLHVEGDQARSEVLWQASEFRLPGGPPPLLRLRPGEGPIWKAAHGGHPVFEDGSGTHPQTLERLRAAGVRALALLPLDGPPARRVLAAARTTSGAAWTTQERALLEAAARTARGVIERRRGLADLERAAFADDLTGLGNRRAFMRDLEAALPGAGMLVVLDVDGFKAVNDADGHARGDEVLRTLGSLLAGAFPGGQGYRLGGDEFAVLAPEACVPRRREILAGIEDELRRAGHAVGLSAGHALFPGEAAAVEPLLALADGRMYVRKRRRRDEVRLARPRR